MIVLERRRSPANLPLPAHGFQCETCWILTQVSLEWVRADPAGATWWRWRTRPAR